MEYSVKGSPYSKYDEFSYYTYLGKLGLHLKQNCSRLCLSPGKRCYIGVALFCVARIIHTLNQKFRVVSEQSSMFRMQSLTHFF